jgi:hypothetical protein
MDRHDTKIEDETFYVESENGWLEVGPLDDVDDLVGGREYTLDYDDDAASAAWLNTEDDNTITFDVRDTLADMTYTSDIVTALQNTPLELDSEGHPRRTVLFADLMTQIWDSKGNIDQNE